MPQKSQLDNDAEDNATSTPTHTHNLLVLLEEFVQKNHGEHLVMRDFKVMCEKLLGPCAKRFCASQVKSKYHRMCIVYVKFKKLINWWDFDNNTPNCDKDVWIDYCKILSYSINFFFLC